MANFTRDAIKNSFLTLLETRPISQITVKDIAAGCGVNRNTFYYYFQDIPTLAEQIVEDDADAIIRKYPHADSIRECLDAAVELIQSHRHAAMHIFQSSNRVAFEQHVWRVCRHTVRQYVDSLLEGRPVPEEEREAVIYYQVCATFGMTIDMLENGVREETREYVLHMSEIYCRLLNQVLTEEQPSLGNTDNMPKN